MSDTPKISVVIPVYNTEKYIRQCVDSVLAQTYQNIEVILVDDGSPDGCPEICDGYAKKDGRVKVLHKANGGVSDSRNQGLHLSSGGFVMYIDSDDWIDERTCETAVKEQLSSGADIVFWGYVREAGEKSLPKKIFKEDRIVFEGEALKNLQRRFAGPYKEELKSPALADSLSPPWGKLFKKDLIEGNGIEFVSTKLVGTSEDALFNLNVFHYAQKAVFINRDFYHYRKSSAGSLTSSYKPEFVSQWNTLRELFLKDIKRLNLPEDFREALSNRVCFNIFGLGLTELKASDKSSLQKIKGLKSIMSQPHYRDAYKKLTLEFFPVHWKVFYFFAKHRFATGVYLMLIVIRKMINTKLR